MNTTAKTALFLVGATVFNIVLMIIFVAAFIVLAGLVLGSSPNPVAFNIVIFVGFIASIVLTFLIYGWVMKRLQAKYDLEKHLPQLFRKKR